MRTSSPLPRTGARRRLEVSLELTLDARLSATSRIILGALVVNEPGPLVHPTDRELADRHGVSERTVRGALAAGERAGWVRRATWAELLEWYPDLAARVPRVCRPRRFVVLLWLFGNIEPAIRSRQPAAAEPAPSGKSSPDMPATNGRPLACARSESSDFERGREERTFVPPPSPPEDPAALWPDMPLQVRDGLARMMAAAAAAEATPGFVPAAAMWEPPKPAPAPTVRVKVEAMVAACLGPDQAAGLNALLLWLATELHDAKPITRAFWSRSIPAILASAEGFDRLVELILAARLPSKRFPARWFSATLAAEARGQPLAAQKPTPGATQQSSPGAGAKAPSNPTSLRTSVYGV